MRSAARRSLAVGGGRLSPRPPGSPRSAGSPPRTPRGSRAAEAPAEVAGYIATVAGRGDGARPEAHRGTTAPEAQAMVGALKAPTSVVSRFYLAQDLSRQEIVSTDFVLPAGTVLLHRAGDRAYVVADPGTKTYAVMDARSAARRAGGRRRHREQPVHGEGRCTPTTRR